MQDGLESKRSVGKQAGLALTWLIGLLLTFNVCASDLTGFGAITNNPDVRRPGKPIWMDLLTSDVPTAVTFYSDVFDWKFEYNMDGSYAYATLNGEPVAAIAEYESDQKQAEGLWLVSISVADLDAALEKVKASGGRVLEPAENLAGRGNAAVVEDPQGAVFMLLHSESGDPVDSDTVHHDWLWVELWTNSVPEAVQFYEDVFNYRSLELKGNAGTVMTVLGRDQVPRSSVIEIQLDDVEPNWLGYLQVKDVDATARKVLNAGGRVLIAPQKDELNADVAIVADPTGGVFALQQQEAK